MDLSASSNGYPQTHSPLAGPGGTASVAHAAKTSPPAGSTAAASRHNLRIVIPNSRGEVSQAWVGLIKPGIGGIERHCLGRWNVSYIFTVVPL